MNYYCTYLDSNYLAKGMVAIESLMKNTDENVKLSTRQLAYVTEFPEMSIEIGDLYVSPHQNTTEEFNKLNVYSINKLLLTSKLQLS